MNYIATPDTRTHAPGVIKITTLIDPYLFNITIYPVCLTCAWQRTLKHDNYCTDFQILKIYWMADRQPNVELQMSSDAWTNKQYSSDCMTGGQFC